MNDNSKPGGGGEFDRAISGFIAEVEDDETSGEWVSPLRLRSVYFPGLTAAHAADLLAATEPLKREIKRLNTVLKLYELSGGEISPWFGEVAERRIPALESKLAAATSLSTDLVSELDEKRKRIAALEAELNALKQPSDDLKSMLVRMIPEYLSLFVRDAIIEAVAARENALKAEIDELRAYKDAVSDVFATLKSASTESTRSPWWTIVDPVQNMDCDVYRAAFQITDPFFSRKDAEDHLSMRRHAFTKRAVVYCHSGSGSKKYEAMYKAIAKYEGGAK